MPNNKRLTLVNNISIRMVQDNNKCQSFLSKIDIFSYIPVPHTYPISSRKSKIGSLLFICIILGYLLYDLVKFITANTPVVNLYYESTPNNKQYSMPSIAFGYVYGPDLNQTLNDPSYMTYSFDTITTNYVNSSLQSNKTTRVIASGCRPQWLGVYNNVYKNLSCINQSMQIMNPPLKRPNSISQRLTISLCVPGNPENITCQNSSQIASRTAGGRFVLIINQPQGFDFNTGSVTQSDYPFQIYQFFLVPGLYNRITLQFYPFNYVTYPTFLTSWSQNQYFYFKSSEPVSLLSNVSIFNTYLTASISFSISAELTQVKVHYQTIIEHVSMWGALASLLFTILGLCCLAYNKNKFLKKNPTWGQFDVAMKKKIQLELQTTIARDPDQDASGISSIRKQVELTHDL